MPSYEDYTVSIHYDRRLFRHDIAGSIAHARMLAKTGIISDEDARQIIHGLGKICAEIEDGSFPWDASLEDLHMNIESRLHHHIGAAAGRLHTGRSRNDQIALDMRLYVKEVGRQTADGLRGVQGALVALAEKYPDVLMPGYTHLQRAQPVLFAHHMLAGVPYPTDREFLAKELGFASVSANSMDAVSDRDFIAEFLAAAALCMMHFSRLAEELVLWSSREFGFIRLEDAFTTGSSIMPQKRNPDFAELARGRTGRVYGNLMAILTVLKGLPLTYNRDLQEDKEGIFDTVDTLLPTLEVFQGMLGGLTLDVDRVTSLAGESYMLATDLADYLVGKGVPFRLAHGIMRELCEHCESTATALGDLSIDEYQRFSEHFTEDVFQITAQSSAAARDNPGGTAPRRVAEELKQAMQILLEAGNGF